MIITYTFFSIIAVSLISLLGIFTLAINENKVKKYIYFFVSLAIGALLGDAFIHLIPEAFENSENSLLVSLYIIAGIFIFFIIEKTIHWHHHLEEEDVHKHEHLVTGKMILVSDSLHNFIDGIIIAASYMISIEIGIATTIAVLIHEIPQEIGDFGVLIHAGFSKYKALLFNFISALTALLGAIMVFVFGNIIEITEILLPIAAGGFIYIAMADLIPELQKEKHDIKDILTQLVFIIIGILAMVALLALE